LPGRYGIGDLGPEAREFASVLAGAGQAWWQMLPLGPTGYGNSPYQSHSSFAGNPLLISPDDLAEQGWLKADDLADVPDFPEEAVDFDAVKDYKTNLLRLAFSRFPKRHDAFDDFVGRNQFWLDNYALYSAIKESQGGRAWYDWEPRLRDRDADAMAGCRKQLDEPIRFQQFVQFLFEGQWQALRKVCLGHEIRLIGDLPIFVAGDSADVWAHRDLFDLDGEGRPRTVAGVPPDLFSETGQLWGNPLYRWDVHAEDRYAWWAERLGALLARVDLVRIDHFRGFEAYWEVPAGAETAVGGRWVPGPGHAFFEVIAERLGGLPFIAEDLGVITPAVEALRDQFNMPGMKILQFAFSPDPESEKYLPHSYLPHCVVYTGTHDNDTTVGWFSSNHVETTQSLEEIQTERAYALRYLGTSGEAINWDLIRLALASVADTAVCPLQDLLGLGSEARMNVPGRAQGNWSWRFCRSQLEPQLLDRLARLTATYGRWPGPIPTTLDPRHVEGRRADTAAAEVRESQPLASSTRPGRA
jgi:4-alpha-glucanotransferase